MSAAVEHDARKKKILSKALDVFMDEGYEDTTFQKISDRCGITRTTLYIYFKNKKEIFLSSIKQLLSQLEHDIMAISRDQDMSVADRLVQVLTTVLNQLEKNSRLLKVVLDYLLYISRSEGSPDARVKRRTVKMRHYLSDLVIEGIKSGEIKNLDVTTANELLFDAIDSALFRLAILDRGKVPELKKAVPRFVKFICSTGSTKKSK
jgi:AcrR family transcriptional regulator